MQKQRLRTPPFNSVSLLGPSERAVAKELQALTKPPAEGEEPAGGCLVPPSAVCAASTVVAAVVTWVAICCSGFGGLSSVACCLSYKWLKHKG